MFSPGDRNSADVLVQIENQLQRVSRSQVGQRGLGNLQADAGLDLAAGSDLLMRPGHREPFLQNFVGRQSETELWGRPNNTRRTTLEERLEAFLLPDSCGAVAETRVVDLTLASFDLQTRLDDIAGRSEVSSGHTGNGTGGEKLHNTELVGLGFAEEVGLEVRVGREVDGGERNCQ